MSPNRLLAAAALAVLWAAAARAETFHYRGDVQVTATSGAGCSGARPYTIHNVDLMVRDDAPGMRYEGFVGGQGLSVRRIAGARLDQLSVTVAVSDPKLAARFRLSLSALGSDALSGHTEAASVPADTPGCYIDTADLNLSRVAGPAGDYLQRAAMQFHILQLQAQWATLWQEKDYGAALPVARQAEALAEQSFDAADARLAPSLVRLIATLMCSGNAPEAAVQLRRAFALDGRSPVRNQQILGELTQTTVAAHKYAEFESLLRQTIALEEKATPPADLATYLNYLGYLLQSASRYADAEPVLRRALRLDEQTLQPNDPQLAYVVSQLGQDLMYTGQYAESEQLLRRAVAIAEKTTPPVYLGDYLNTLSDMLRIVGRFDESEALARRSLALAEKSGAPERIAAAATVLGILLSYSGRDAESEPYVRQALQIFEKIDGPAHPDVAVALNNLGLTLVQLGRYRESEPPLQRAINIWEANLGPLHVNLTRALMNLGTALMQSGDYAGAEPDFQRAYRIAAIAGVAPPVWRTPSKLMELYGNPHVAQPELAIFYGKKAVNTFQGLRGNLGGAAGAQESFLNTVEPTYRKLADLLIQQGRLGEAQQVLALLKEQEYFEFIKHGAGTQPRITTLDFTPAETKLAQPDAQIVALDKESAALHTKLEADGKLSAAEKKKLDGLPAQIEAAQTVFQGQVAALRKPTDQKLQDLGTRYVALGKEYGALQEKFRNEGDKFSAQDHARLGELRNAMDAAQATFDARAAEVAKNSNDPEAQKRRQHEINDFSRAFQGTLKELGHDAVLAQYFILDDKVSILLTTPNAVVSRESAIKRAALNAQIQSFRNSLRNPRQDPRPEAQSLYRLLVGPIADDLRQAGAKTLMLSLDDTLRYIPFAALNDGKQYLIENYSLVMVTEAVRDKLAQLPIAEWTVWGLGTTRAGPGYDALPWVDVELNGIAGQRGVLHGSVLLDKSFNESSLRDGLDQHYPVIHIASHFQFTPGSMDDSFLLLGDGTHMTLAQIRTKLNFNDVELLTLSACDTALGDGGGAHHGVEVEGLGALAQEAGAKAVLATLWPVADESTSELMRALYQEHRDRHRDKADALRAAQLDLIRGTVTPDATAEDSHRSLTRSDGAPAGGNFKADPQAPFAHPFYWAPFILMGNWL
jgi:CHAT domain-containing protein/Tfp pilus assembly protein PilF